jgi:Yip1-like protein
MSTVTARERAAAPPALPERSGVARRTLDLFFSPGRLFAELRDDPAPGALRAWLAPVLISIAAGVAITLLRPRFISDAQMAEFVVQQWEAAGREASAEELAGQMRTQERFGLLFITAWTFIRVAVVGGVLYGVGVLLGASERFRTYAAVASWAFLVVTLGFLVDTALKYASGDLSVGVSFAALVERPAEPGLGYNVLSALTPFRLWQIALLGIGAATLARRKEWLLPALVLLALFLGAAALSGAVFGSLGGG